MVGSLVNTIGCPLRYIQSREYHSSKITYGGNAVCASFLSNRLDFAHNLYRRDLYAHYGCVNAIEFSNDGCWLISGGDDRRVLMWNIESSMNQSEKWKPVSMKEEHRSNIFCLGFDSENMRIFSAGNDEQVIIHDVATKEAVNVFLHEEAIYGVSINPLVPSVFASAGEDGQILIFDSKALPSASPLQLAKSYDAFHSVQFHPTEPTFVVSANSKEGVVLWDVRKPRVPCIKYGFRKNPQSSMCARFNSTGTQIIALRRRMHPILFNTHSDVPVCEFDADYYYNSCTMKSCCFAGSRDQFVLSGSDDFNLYMWKIPDPTFERAFVPEAHLVLKGHRSIVNQVRFNVHNFTIASSGVEKIVKLWSPICGPGSVGTLRIERSDTHMTRKVYTHEDYIRLVLDSGQTVSHDYSHGSTDEDPKMMAFFDSLVQREVEGWTTNTDDHSEDDEGGDRYRYHGLSTTASSTTSTIATTTYTTTLSSSSQTTTSQSDDDDESDDDSRINGCQELPLRRRGFVAYSQRRSASAQRSQSSFDRHQRVVQGSELILRLIAKKRAQLKIAKRRKRHLRKKRKSKAAKSFIKKLSSCTFRPRISEDFNGSSSTRSASSPFITTRHYSMAPYTTMVSLDAVEENGGGDNREWSGERGEERDVCGERGGDRDGCRERGGGRDGDGERGGDWDRCGERGGERDGDGERGGDGERRGDWDGCGDKEWSRERRRNWDGCGDREWSRERGGDRNGCGERGGDRDGCGERGGCSEWSGDTTRGGDIEWNGDSSREWSRHKGVGSNREGDAVWGGERGAESGDCDDEYESNYCRKDKPIEKCNRNSYFRPISWERPGPSSQSSKALSTGLSTSGDTNWTGVSPKWRTLSSNGRRWSPNVSRPSKSDIFGKKNCSSSNIRRASYGRSEVADVSGTDERLSGSEIPAVDVSVGNTSGINEIPIVANTSGIDEIPGIANASGVADTSRINEVPAFNVSEVADISRINEIPAFGVSEVADTSGNSDMTVDDELGVDNVSGITNCDDIYKFSLEESTSFTRDHLDSPSDSTSLTKFSSLKQSSEPTNVSNLVCSYSSSMSDSDHDSLDKIFPNDIFTTSLHSVQQQQQQQLLSDISVERHLFQSTSDLSNVVGHSESKLLVNGKCHIGPTRDPKSRNMSCVPTAVQKGSNENPSLSGGESLPVDDKLLSNICQSVKPVQLTWLTDYFDNNGFSSLNDDQPSIMVERTVTPIDDLNVSSTQLSTPDSGISLELISERNRNESSSDTDSRTNVFRKKRNLDFKRRSYRSRSSRLNEENSEDEIE